ncbi:MAG: LON peptidase substrate-binding domain-containing protein, partial [Gallicola sp.]|nr:LON peptidase substrate-binding domain-containing protein [Gallicola sp.]
SRIMLLTQKDYKNMEPKTEDLYEIGTVAVIRQILKLPQGQIRVLIEGEKRAEVKSFSDSKDYLSATIGFLENDESELSVTEEAAFRLVKQDLESYVSNNSKINTAAIEMLNDRHGFILSSY